MKENEIKLKLEHQFRLIWKSLNSLEYLINFPIYLEQADQKRPLGLWFLYEIIRDNTVLNLNKLYDPKEDYCFDRINRYIFEEFQSESGRAKQITELLRSAKKIHTKLQIKDIRNKHVGHLDENRIHINLDWNEVKKLIELSCDIHDKINLLLFNCQSAWQFENKVLNSILINDFKSKKLVELERQMFKNSIESITREKIMELNRIKWPK